jgi:hypothetical protein
MVRGMLADDVDHGAACLAGVVEVGQGVGESGAEMQKSGRGLAGHASVAIGSAAADALEQAKDAAYLGNVVERRHEAHLRRAGVHETGGHAIHSEGLEERFGAVHGVQRSTERMARRGNA